MNMRILIILTLLVSTCSCVKNIMPVVPSAHTFPVRMDNIPSFTITGPIRLTNTYKEEKKVIIGPVSGPPVFYDIEGDMRLWTDTAITSFKEVLRSKNIEVTDLATKELKFTVTEVAISHLSGITWISKAYCYVTLEVETGDGYTTEFKSYNSTPWEHHRAWDGAVTKAIETMLNNEEILNYIRR